jgi:hypothetical protein
MLNKTIEQMKFMEVRLVVPALVAFYAVSSKCRGAGKKEMEKSTTIHTSDKETKET